MITSASSPNLHTSNCSSPSHAFAPSSQYDSSSRSKLVQPATGRIHGTILHSRATPNLRTSPTTSSPVARRRETIRPSKSDIRSTDKLEVDQVQMVDAGTQYSPRIEPVLSQSVPASGVANLQLEASSQAAIVAPPTSSPESPRLPAIVPRTLDQPGPAAQENEATPASALGTSTKRSTSVVSSPAASSSSRSPSAVISAGSDEAQSAKRLRPPRPAVKLVPSQYERCNPKDLSALISSMLLELIRYNDTIPLRDGHLTRFHSRAPPTISVLDYLQRLTTHATLSPPILLSMVFYIDRLCALYPAFTISSLTVHRFLITTATVASKGLSDSFWTNKTYARVGGIKLKELALLELEFLRRVEWRIVPRPEVLVDYYRSLVDRSEGYEIDLTETIDEGEAAAILDSSATAQSQGQQNAA